MRPVSIPLKLSDIETNLSNSSPSTIELILVFFSYWCFIINPVPNDDIPHTTTIIISISITSNLKLLLNIFLNSSQVIF